MAKLDWCKKQGQGIRLIEPNITLASKYFDSADETIGVLKKIVGESDIWAATTRYYALYFTIYGLLVRLGIKCEIHECTIALSALLEKETILPKGTSKRLDEAKQLRIENQYYLKNQQVKSEEGSLLESLHQMTSSPT